MSNSILTGYHWIQGYFFHTGFQAQANEKRARVRILQMWQPGMRILRHPELQGIIVLSQQPSLLCCGLCPAYPLIQKNEILTNTLLKETELADLPRFESLLALRLQDKLTVYKLSQSQAVDLSAWIDLSQLQILPVKSLGRLPDPPEFKPTQESKPIHELFSNQQLKPADAQKSFIEALQSGDQTKLQSPKKQKPGLFNALIKRWLLRKTHGSNDAMAMKPSSNIFGKLGALIARLTMSSKLGKFLSGRQAQYFRRMLDKFDNGDLMDALRHAIPLASAKDAFEQSKPAMGLPGIRNSLNINFSAAGGGSSYDFGQEFYQYLRKLYRNAFERLDRVGKFQEAAFVLAELLQESEEAISYLEKKGELHLAAKLAEGREVDPALIIRQWFLAGEISRAIRIAKKTGQFSLAINRLDMTHPEEANKLRLLWGHSLHEAGKYATAVEVVWPLEQARNLAISWAELAILNGGRDGARMLAKKISNCPTEYDSLKERTLELLNPPIKTDLSLADELAQAELLEARIEFADSLLREPKTHQTITLARATYRAMLRDKGLSKNNWSMREFDRLSRYANERALRTDTPALFATQSQQEERASYHNSFQLNESGTSRFYHALPLSKLRALLACGESGAVIINQNGKVGFKYNEPVHKLVVSKNGNRAIAIAERGSFLRLSKLNLSEGGSKYWCDVRLQVWSDIYDGTVWYVGMKNRLMAIDVQADDFEILWQVPDLPADIIDLNQTDDSLGVLLNSEPLQYWRYQLPSMLLRQRDELRMQPSEIEQPMFAMIKEEDACICTFQYNDEGLKYTYYSNDGSPLVSGPIKIDHDIHTFQAYTLGEYILVQIQANPDSKELVTTLLKDLRNNPIIEIKTNNVQAATATVRDNKMCYCDTNGQVALIDLEAGQLVWHRKSFW